MFDKAKADHAVNFINCLKHTKGRWRGVPFELLPWQDEIIRTLYGTVKENGYRQYNTCYCEIPKNAVTVNGEQRFTAVLPTGSRLPSYLMLRWIWWISVRH